MRLIDANALKEYVAPSIKTGANYNTYLAALQRCIDAAPTICCERCEHWSPYSFTEGGYRHGECGVRGGLDQPESADFCPYFKEANHETR